MASCSSSKNTSSGNTSLKSAFKKDFLIGTALNTEQIEGTDSAAINLVEKQFDAITPENVMKSGIIHPEWNRYDFSKADAYIALGQKNKMYIVGHTLIWHSQLSPFVRKIQSPDSIRLFMQQHIATVAGRYAGKINSWDVVNEALNEDGTLRKSVFYEKLGEGYIQTAFELAAKAAPGTALYYNDYNIEQPKKRAGAIALIKKLQAAGVRIDGVGIQGHWHLDDIPLKDIEQSIIEYSALGIKIAFTELDISVLPSPQNQQGADVNQHFNNSRQMNPYTNSLPDSIAQKLAEKYEALFRVFLKYKNNISRVTFWGVNDAQSWLNNFPVPGRTNYPLLFDRNNKPKAAYYKIIRPCKIIYPIAYKHKP